MSPITYNTSAIEDRAARIARFEAAMNAKATDLNSTVDASTVAQGVRARIQSEARPAFFSQRDITAGLIFGGIVFAAFCVAFALHLI